VGSPTKYLPECNIKLTCFSTTAGINPRGTLYYPEGYDIVVALQVGKMMRGSLSLGGL